MFGALLGFLAVALCIAANAFFVAGEFALVTIRHTWVEERARTGHAAACSVRELTSHLDDAIAATQLGITIASIALGWLGEPAFARLVGAGFGHMMPRTAVHAIAAGLAFTTITFLHVVLGELAPKAVALGDAQRVALFVARPLLVFQRIFRPLIGAMNRAGNFAVRLLGFSPAPLHARVHSVGELKMLIDETHGAGSLDPTQAEVALRTLELQEVRVRDVMVPIARVVTLDLEMTDRQVLDRILASEYTRMPVFSRRRGRFIGVANVKKVLLGFARDRRVRLRDALYQPLTLHHAATLTRALRTFKRRKQHLAFVSGDDGAQIGIVTLEDILEAMVGDIDDELDVEDDAEHASRMSRGSIERAEHPSRTSIH
ncbi:MAG: hemolysin family protein [Polyangiales bacterium]